MQKPLSSDRNIQCPECLEWRVVRKRIWSREGFTGCCKPCYGKFHRRRMGGRETRTCQICENEYEVFKYRSKTQKTCSWDCHKIYMSKKYKGKYAVGENNPHWKEEPSYGSLHDWVRRHKKKTGFCTFCGKKGIIKGHEYGTHFANISHEYKRDLDDYVELCMSCHRKYDNLTKI